MQIITSTKMTILLALLLLILGCQIGTSDGPNLTDIRVEPSYVAQGEQFNIGFLVNNPLTFSFQGVVEFKSDCIQSQSLKKEVSVSANDNVPFKNDFTVYKKPMYQADTEKDKCKGVQDITIFLEDKDKKVIASYITQLNIVE